MPECAQPDAPSVDCCICGKRVKTCERKEPIVDDSFQRDYTCPVHGEGCQLQNGKWVCSFKHWEVAMKKYYGLVS